MKLDKISQLKRKSAELQQAAKAGIIKADQGWIRTVNVELHLEALLRLLERRTLWQRLFRNITLREVEQEAKIVLAERTKKQNERAASNNGGTGEDAGGGSKGESTIARA